MSLGEGIVDNGDKILYKTNVTTIILRQGRAMMQCTSEELLRNGNWALNWLSKRSRLGTSGAFVSENIKATSNLLLTA